jgi:hypothetical protein
MRLAIPNVPRKVSLRQVPGALARLSIVAAVGVALVAVLGVLGSKAGGWLSKEKQFFAAAVEVPGKVTQVTLPPRNQREGGVARLSVIYAFPEDFDRSAAGVATSALFAEGIGVGATVPLLVHPDDPDHPREGGYERDREGLQRFIPFGIGFGVLLALGLFGFELKRSVKSELDPLRTGMLVWLTPDEALSDSKSELVFPGSYYRQDLKIPVRARARPGRAPVRNGEKLLAAVVPSRPTWVRVIDEDLARSLGWFINS